MKNPRIVFMGTPEFAVYILQHLIAKKHQIVGVITAPDRPAGRGQKIQESAVKKYAQRKNLKILQPTNLRAEAFHQELKQLAPDIGVVVAFRMLPKSVWDLPTLGTFNLHASLLPDYRGAAPINWALINGETQTGVTTFFLDENIDTGAIIAQNQVEITQKDDAGTLHDKLMEQGALLVDNTLQMIATHNIQPKEQKPVQALKNAPKLNSSNTKVDWRQSPKAIYDFVRGLYPYPIAWTNLQNGTQVLRCKLFKVEIEDRAHQMEVGKIEVADGKFRVAVPEGFILVKEMQLPGKKRMPVQQLLNGLRLDKNAHMY